MDNSQNKRNAAIIRQHQTGKRPSEIARDFKISPGRVRQIVNGAERDAKRRAELEKKYGLDPNIAALPDSTPIEVLLLCIGKIQGWAARLRNLQHPPYDRTPIQTLGDLRSTTDAQLLKEPNVGSKMVKELRRFCPANTDETLERLFAKVRVLPPERKALAIDALTKICDGQ